MIRITSENSFKRELQNTAKIGLKFLLLIDEKGEIFIS